MRTTGKWARSVTILAVVILLGVACGDDSSAIDTAADQAGQADPADEGTEPTDAGAQESDADADSDSDSDSDSEADAGSDTSGAAGSVDCAEVREALDAAGSGFPDGTSTDSDDLEAGFTEAKAQLEALKSAAPEISGDVDQVLAGMEAMGEALAGIGWDPNSFAGDPEEALAFAELLSNPAIIGMTQGLTGISGWVASACS